MANGENGKDPTAEGPALEQLQITYNPATGKIGLHGAHDGNMIVWSHILADAADALRARVKQKHLNAALGAAPLSKRIIPVRGQLPPFDEHGIRGGGR